MDAVSALKASLLGDDNVEWQSEASLERRREEDRTFRRLDTAEVKREVAEIAAKGRFKALVDARGEIMDALEVYPPEVEIRTRGLTVKADARVGSDRVPTVWSAFKKSLLRLCFKPKMQEVTLLDDINLLLKPGEATLLLGPPGAGKTVLLQMLSDTISGKKDLRVGGEITYNGRTLGEFKPRTTAAYVDQIDNHIAILTVRETFRFAVKCAQNPFIEYVNQSIKKKWIEDPSFFDSFDPEVVEMAGHASSDRFREEMILHVLGLSNCADTIIGDALLRGVSGGEKKRVTTGELIVSGRRVMFLDEISTGLDSATTFSVADSLIHVTHKLKLTSLISLLQPPPETFGLFDNVLLLAEGQLLYFGPLDGILPFFESIGFSKPEEVEIADFLQQITTASGQEKFYKASQKHLTADEDKLSDAGNLKVSLLTMKRLFYESEQGRKLLDSLRQDIPFSPERDEGLCFKNYSTSYKLLFKTVLQRWITIVVRDKRLWIAKICQNILLGIILGTLFYNMTVPGDYFGFFGVLFSSVMFMSLGNMPQMTLAQASRSVFFKQRDANFFPASAYTLSASLVYLPYSLMDAILFSVIVYFMVGLSTNGAGYFFTFLLIIFSQAACMSALFRMIGNLAPTMIHANAFGGTALLILIAMSGFTIIRTSIPDYWIWAYYASPFAYAIRSLAINEMTSPNWGQLTPSGQTVGEEILTSFGIFTDRIWIWMGVLALWVFYIIFTAVTSFALSILPGPQKQAFIPDKVKPGTGQVGFSEDEEFRHEPLTLTFDKIQYFVPNPAQPQEQLELLKGISGYALPGTLTALMGSSGAGKTTLMDVIAGRKTGGEIRGDIKLNGFIKEQNTFKRVMGYVEQTDIHSPLATFEKHYSIVLH